MESAKEGSPLPNGIVYGKLPRKYQFNNYLEKLEPLFNKTTQHQGKIGQSPDEFDHFNFALWFESRCAIRRRPQFAKYYAFALSGIGIFPEEQVRLIERLGVDCHQFITRKPSQNYYPKVLPLSLWELFLKQDFT